VSLGSDFDHPRSIKEILQDFIPPSFLGHLMGDHMHHHDGPDEGGILALQGILILIVGVDGRRSELRIRN